MEERFAVGLIVNNRFGVLDRIAGLYAKRCYNIDAISAGPTENPEYTRLTIVSTGDEYMKDQVVRQLYKLYDVKTVALLEQEHTLFAQHMFVKMHLTGTEGEAGEAKAEIIKEDIHVDAKDIRTQVLELINEYGGKVVDFGEEHLTAEITGTKEKVDSFVEKIRKFGILELSSSGDIAIGIGWDNTLSVAPREAEEDQPEP